MLVRVALASLLALPVAARAADPPALCTLTDPRLTEVSGLVSSGRAPEVLFVHNDSGDTARFIAIDTRCRTRATYPLPGVTATDWEDIARGPGSVLWLADIGDNRAARATVRVVRVSEPVVPAVSSRAPTLPLASTSYSLTYPDGPHDAETLLCDPADGRLYVVTKSFTGRGRLYAAPLPLRPDAVNPLVALDAFRVLATGGDVSPDGTTVALRGYQSVYVARVPTGSAQGPRLAGVFAAGPGEVLGLPAEKQGEAIGWSSDSRSLLTTSEGIGAPLHRVTVTGPAASPTPSPETTPSSSSRPGIPAQAPVSRGSREVTRWIGAGLLLLAGSVGGFWLSRSRRAPRASRRPDRRR